MKRADVLKALEIIKPGLRSTSKNMSDDRVFMFEPGFVMAYNDSLFLRHPVVGLELSGSIQAEEFHGLIARLSGDDVELSVNGNEVRLSSDKVEAGFTLQEDVKPLSDEVSDHGKWKPLPKTFKEALEFTMMTCASSMARPELTCINVREDGRLESSDNYRISIYESEPFGVKTFLLPSAAAEVIVGCEIEKIAEGNSWIHFKTTAGTVIGCRVFSEKFPLLDKLLKVSGTDVEFPVSVLEVLERAVVFCVGMPKLEQRATITIKDKVIKLRVEIETAWFEEDKRMAYDGKHVKFVINPSLLKFILEQTLACTVGENCLKFTGDSWQHVVALVEE
jgi:hypothetical protein